MPFLPARPRDRQSRELGQRHSCRVRLAGCSRIGPVFQQRARLEARALRCPRRIKRWRRRSGNFPVFEGTSLYSLRIDHNINSNNRLMLRAQREPQYDYGNRGQR